jgi:hypothetical protein
MKKLEKLTTLQLSEITCLCTELVNRIDSYSHISSKIPIRIEKR